MIHPRIFVKERIRLVKKAGQASPVIDHVEEVAKGNPAKKSITEAPLLIAICAKLKSSGYDKGEAFTQIGDWSMYDLGMANQNLCLMSHNLGLGTVVVAWFDRDRVNEILGVSSGYKALTIILLEYPTADAKAPDRREIGDFTHTNKFGGTTD
jgi:nitroreductase